MQVVGTTDQFPLTGGISTEDGRFFSAFESEQGRQVCVLGSGIATNLFPAESPLGKKVSIGARPFEVVGVLEKQGSGLDNQLIIPLQQMLVAFGNGSQYQIRIKVANIADMDNAKEELRAVMRVIRRLAPTDDDNFAINQQDQFLAIFHRVAGTIAVIGLFITGLSLFVGGIGIMNIMFVSVAERTREIGVRKAIGAKRRTILLQFLIEAAVHLPARRSHRPGHRVAARHFCCKKSCPPKCRRRSSAFPFWFALLTGVISGFFPAWRAARMNPVDALRNE